MGFPVLLTSFGTESVKQQKKSLWISLRGTRAA